MLLHDTLAYWDWASKRALRPDMIESRRVVHFQRSLTWLSEDLSIFLDSHGSRLCVSEASHWRCLIERPSIVERFLWLLTWEGRISLLLNLRRLMIMISARDWPIRNALIQIWTTRGQSIIMIWASEGGPWSYWISCVTCKVCCVGLLIKRCPRLALGALILSLLAPRVENWLWLQGHEIVRLVCLTVSSHDRWCPLIGSCLAISRWFWPSLANRCCLTSRYWIRGYLSRHCVWSSSWRDSLPCIRRTIWKSFIEQSLLYILDASCSHYSRVVIAIVLE